MWIWFTILFIEYIFLSKFFIQYFRNMQFLHKLIQSEINIICKYDSERFPCFPVLVDLPHYNSIRYRKKFNKMKWKSTTWYEEKYFDPQNNRRFKDLKIKKHERGSQLIKIGFYSWFSMKNQLCTFRFITILV